jgi:TctA family transporter
LLAAAAGSTAGPCRGDARAFAINDTVFGVVVMRAAGVLAFVMEENGFPVAPAILGVVLGGMLEENFVTSMIKSDGDLTAFFGQPIAAALGAFTIAVWLTPLLLRLLRARVARGSPS